MGFDMWLGGIGLVGNDLVLILLGCLVGLFLLCCCGCFDIFLVLEFLVVVCLVVKYWENNNRLGLICEWGKYIFLNWMLGKSGI